MDSFKEVVCLMGVGPFRDQDSTIPKIKDVAQILVTNIERGGVFVYVGDVGLRNVPLFKERGEMNIISIRYGWNNPGAKLVIVPRDALSAPEYLETIFRKNGISLIISLDLSRQKI